MDGEPAGSSGPASPTARPKLTSSTTRARLREIFGRRGFRQLFATRLVSQVGDGVFQLSAGAVLLFDHPGKNPALALVGVFAVALIPYSAIGPFVGVFIDRWERRTILTWVPIGRAVVAALIPAAALLGKRGWAFYLVVLIVLSSNRFFLATISAVLPQLVDDEDLLLANTAATTGGSISNVIGQGLGAGISALTGGTVASALSSAAFAGSAFTARSIPVHRGFLPERRPLWQDIKDVTAEMVEGARDVAANARVVYALTAVTVVQLFVGAMTGVLVYFFIHVLQLSVGSAVGVLGVLAVGIGLGVLSVPFLARKIRRDRLIPLAFVVGGLGNVISAPHLTRTSGTIGTVLVGASYALAKIPVDTIVQEEMDDVVRGRAFSLYDMVFNLARVVGIGIVAAVYQFNADSGWIVWSIAATFFIAAGFFAAWEGRREMGRKGLFRRGRKRASRRPADLLIPGEMVTVRAYAGSRADEEPRAIVIAGQEVPIDQIDWRAIVEETGRRARIFVVRAGGRRVRLAHQEEAGWEIERVGPIPSHAAERPAGTPHRRSRN